MDCVEVHLVLFFDGQVEVAGGNESRGGGWRAPPANPQGRCSPLRRRSPPRCRTEQRTPSPAVPPTCHSSLAMPRARAWASMPADWSMPTAWRRLAATIGKYRPVPHGASRHDATDGARGQQPPDPLLLDPRSDTDLRRTSPPHVVVRDDSRPPLVDPRSSVHPGLPMRGPRAKRPHPETCDCHARCPPPQQIGRQQAPAATISGRLLSSRQHWPRLPRPQWASVPTPDYRRLSVA